MKKNFINTVHISGYVYEHKLEKKVTGPNSKAPGTEFISGTLSIATDAAMTNIVTTHFTYVTALTSKGIANNTFNVLSNIINGTIPNVMEHGKENAGLIRINSSALALKEFYSSASGTEELISVLRNEGGLVFTMSEPEAEDKSATFECDILLTGARRVEEDPENETPEKVILSGYVFNFHKEILPLTLTVLSKGGMDYFEGLEPSKNHPVFTRVSGIEVDSTVVKRTTEEGAWGEVKVKEVVRNHRDFVVTWATPNPYELGSEDTLTAEEINKMLADRELMLAGIKQRQDEWRASRGNALASAVSPVNTIAKGGYNF